jgi:predicted nucleic acid-binding protein
MPARPIIVNNTPLVALWVLNRLDLLRDLYEVVWIPEAVEREFVAIEVNARRLSLLQSPWIQVVRVSNPRLVLSYIGLDQGETKVLALAVEHNAQLVVIDERKGRRYAQRLGLALTGTLGILLNAKQKQLIPAVAP